MKHHLIKKYPNRRLYDTEASKYITLNDLKDMISKGTCVKVIDTNSDDDITRSILLQIIIEAETAGEPMFSSETLQQIIRFYGGTLQGMFAKYFEESLQMFVRQQSQMKDAFGADPLTAMSKMAEQNMAAWSEFQNQFFNMGKSTKNKNQDAE